ncbi:MAG: YdeI/OmpD-associated family protein [Verrucomicrobia bacterium]|nr:YdeI/OmpD-associated family protein [Verrucomicrobiota bacterium]MBV9658055.1 YdeI/OmpD-associated family protein [Verrucomicrobiota bacterium]
MSRHKNPDAWLADAPEFSRPICAALREWIVAWEPDLAQAIKWNILMFCGRKMVCGLGAFKQHANLMIFRGAELPDPAGLFAPREDDALMRKLRLDATHPLESVDRKALRAILRAAVLLDAEPALPEPPRTSRPRTPPPDFLALELQKNPRASAYFAALPPSAQREYIRWLTDAKRPETRERRLAETLAALAAGRRWENRKVG